jgi:hypothetical protein
MRALRLTCTALAVLLLFALSVGGDSYKPPIRTYHLDHSGEADVGDATMAITFDEAVGATYTTEGGAFVMDVNGSPARKTDGFWPNGLDGAQGHGWTFDGINDYLSITDAASGGAFDPTGSFSVMVVVTPDSVDSTYDFILGKYVSGGTRSWVVWKYQDDITFALSNDGTNGAGHFTTLGKNSCLAAGRQACVVVSYRYISDGSSVASIYIDELTAATTSSANGPIYNSTIDFAVGGQTAGLNQWDGTIHHVEYVDGTAWSEDYARMRCRQYMGTLSSQSTGQYVAASSATPPALMVAPPDSGTEPFLVDQPANSARVGSPATGRGGAYGAGGITNLAERSSFETWVAGSPTGWAEAGTGDCAESTARIAHGQDAVRCTLSDAVETVTLTGNCFAVSGATDYHASIFARLESGTGDLNFIVYEDDTADCSSPTGHTTIGCTPLSYWDRRVDTPYTTQAGTVAAQIVLELPAGAAQVVDLDAVQFKPGALPTDAFCSTDANAPAVCTPELLSINSPISANGQTQIEFVASSPWAGTELGGNVTLLSDGGVGAANSYRLAILSSTAEPQWIVYDGTATPKYTITNIFNLAANTDYTLKVFTDGLSNLRLWWNSAWQTVMGGAGTGIRSAAQTITYLGNSGDVWLRDLNFFRRYRP